MCDQKYDYGYMLEYHFWCYQSIGLHIGGKVSEGPSLAVLCLFPGLSNDFVIISVFFGEFAVPAMINDLIMNDHQE